jgi:hypothetical protein
MNKGLVALLFFTLISETVIAQKSKVKYKTGKRIDFQSLLIEGEKKKADYSVVTGNLGEKDFGLLKIKKNFVKEMKFDAKESIQ